MSLPRNLSAKLVGIQVFFLLVALVSIGLTLVVSWRLEGSAAAINDAGSLRMRTYRLAYLADRSDRNTPDVATLIARGIGEFEAVVANLRAGDPRRPLFVPRTPEIDRQFDRLGAEWSGLRPALERAAQGRSLALERPRVERFVAVVNALVEMIEADTARATTLLRTIQFALVALAIGGTSALIYLSFRIIIQPVHRLERSSGAWRRASSPRDCRWSRPTSSARWPPDSTTWRSTWRSPTGTWRRGWRRRPATSPSRTRAWRPSTT
ncbi:MAG: type IV pili methyl-accepting chemotaxis transducer N-terminal domain-containing protein [Betaproteobacteria bacterium]|nr:type IV pili methyl-accepting chemotaxis transducer N-terminal domain-containing protein [Betaproteobacteria bacterium]